MALPNAMADEDLRPLTENELETLRKVARECVDSESADSPLYQQLLERAAVVGAFSREELIEGFERSPALDAKAREVLDRSSVVTEGNSRKWMLDPTTRRQTLENMGERAKQVLQGVAVHPTDARSRALAKVINNELSDEMEASTGDLLELVEAAKPFQSSPAVKESLSRWEEKLEKRQRQAHADRLLKLVDKGVFGRDADAAKLLAHAKEGTPVLPLVIHGAGGIGKSTLLAQLIRDRQGGVDQSAAPVVYLDFARAALNPMDAASLVSDVAQQLSLQFPRASPHFLSFRTWLRDTVSVKTIEQSARSSAFELMGYPVDRSLTANVTAKLVAYLRLAKLADGPFLLVLDTFEEVQARGEEAVASVFEWLAAFAMALPQLRTVIAARSAISAPERDAPSERSAHYGVSENHELGELDRDAGLQMLQSRGIDAGLGDTIFQNVGGNPLSLVLAAELTRRGDSVVMAWRQPGAKPFRAGLNEAALRGKLYLRLFAHIEDPQIRTLAGAATLLRRVTAETIQEVLAPAINAVPDDEHVEVSSLAQAREMFDQLGREVDKLLSSDDDSLVYPRSVRAKMLPIIREESRALFDCVHRLAAEYYSRGQSTAERAEWTYHKLMMQWPPSTTPSEPPSLLLVGKEMTIIRSLGPEVEDLPEEAGRLVRGLLTSPMNQEEIGKLPPEVWASYATTRAMQFVREGRHADAKAIIAQRPDTFDDAVALYAHAMVLFQKVEWAATDAAIEQAEKVTVEKPLPLRNQIVERGKLEAQIAIEHAFLAWYRGVDDVVAQRFGRARAIAAERGDEMHRIEALAGTLSVQEDAAGIDELRALTSALSKKAWSVRLSTLRRLVFLGFADENSAAAALHLLRLRLRSPRRMSAFAADLRAELDPVHLQELQLLANEQPAGMAERDRWENQASKLEQTIGQYLVERRSPSLPRAALYVRAQFATWRVPMRVAVMAAFREFATLERFLTAHYPQVLQSFAAYPQIYEMQVDMILSAVEDLGVIPQFLRDCAANVPADGDKAKLEAVNFALGRYTHRVLQQLASGAPPSRDFDGINR
jgi:hypothetical protein